MRKSQRLQECAGKNTKVSTQQTADATLDALAQLIAETRQQLGPKPPGGADSPVDVYKRSQHRVLNEASKAVVAAREDAAELSAAHVQARTATPNCRHDRAV